MFVVSVMMTGLGLNTCKITCHSFIVLGKDTNYFSIAGKQVSIIAMAAVNMFSVWGLIPCPDFLRETHKGTHYPRDV